MPARACARMVTALVKLTTKPQHHMRAKQYPAEKVESLAQALESAPELPQKSFTTEEILKRYERQIHALHKDKHYGPSEIAKLLKSHGVVVPIRELKRVLNIAPSRTPGRTRKSD